MSLPEVERAFEEFDGGDARSGQGRLGEVCAIALSDDGLGSIVALVIEPGAQGSGSHAWDGDPTAPDKAALLDHARAELAPQFVPRRFYSLDRLPRTVGGKIRRHETVDLVMSGKAQRL